MSGYLERVQSAVKAWDAERPRSQQTTVGWSEAMDCRAALGFKLAGTWPTDTTDTWAAIVGTALHAFLTDRLQFKEDEYTVEYKGLPGHPDHVEVGGDALREWKFTSVANRLTWERDPEAFLGKRVQAHGYAAGLIAAGVLTEQCTVTVLAMPRDGTFTDWWEHTEPFQRDLADAGIARVTEVQALLQDGRYIPRDKPLAFCESWCEFFTACRGSDGPTSDLIRDPELASMVDRYADIGAQVGPLEKEKKRLAARIRGLRGVTEGGTFVSETQPAGTKQIPDLDAIARDYAHSGADFPTREVPTSSPSLQVRRAKPRT